MFEAHAYDRWTTASERSGFFWELTRHLAGFPSRLFLLLAGVSLVLRLDGQRRRQTDERTAVRSNLARGLEIWLLALAFRFSGWALGGAHLHLWKNLLRVDILNCIGVSLTLGALLLRPRHVTARAAYALGGAALAIVWATPFVERWGRASSLAGNPLFWYLTGFRPHALFPLFPWLAYFLVGLALGIIWVRAIAEQRMKPTMLRMSALGIALLPVWLVVAAVTASMPVFATADPGASAPSSFFYRTGMCLFGAGLFYWLSERRPPSERFSMLEQLGQTSLFVYWVHIEIVYGHISDPVHRKLSFAGATLLLVVLSLLMVLLSVAKTRYFERWRAKKSAVRKTA